MLVFQVYGSTATVIILQGNQVEHVEITQPTFPSVHITTYYNPFTVEREFWHDGTVSITGAATGQNFTDSSAQIRGRGNSTWRNGQDKRPLRIRFDTEQAILGSDYEATDWILLANHFDRSLMRNYAALHLGGLLSGLCFTPVSNHIHLYVNGEYMGVYNLTDERDVNPGRMQLDRSSTPGRSDFFFELDARASTDGVLNETFIRVNGLNYDMRFPGSSRRTPEHVEYLYNYISSVSYAIRNQSFDEVLALIDLDSFIDFYLVHELFKEYDVVNQLSIFMYIQGRGEDRRLFMGPIWDFDLAAGNFKNQPLGRGPEDLYVAVFNYWYRYLMHRPEFFDAVVDRWNEIADREIAQTIEHVRHTATRYQAEFERNFERHPIMGVAIENVMTPPEMLEVEDFMGHVEWLLDWLEARVIWMDDFFNGRMPGHDFMQVLVDYHTNYHPINISINGQLHKFENWPINLQNRIMLTVQEIAALFNFRVRSNDAGALVLVNDRVFIVHHPGDLHMMVDGVRLEFGVPTALYIQDELYIPLRTIAEILGYNIVWHPYTRTVRMTPPAASPPNTSRAGYEHLSVQFLTGIE